MVLTLHKQVPDEEDGRGQVEVRALHAQVRLQRALSRLGEVRPVQEVEQVHHDQEGEEVQVDLAKEPGRPGLVLRWVLIFEVLDVCDARGVLRRLAWV